MICLFPHILIRIAGGPFEEFSQLDLSQAVSALESIRSERKRLVELKEELCDALFHIIQRPRSPADKVLLINLKRDIFNERKLADEDVRFLCSYFLPELIPDLLEYLQLKDNIPGREQEAQGVFDREVIAARNHLTTLARNPGLQKGLLLSSQALLVSINSYYLKRDGASLSRKDHDTEEGLIKYLSRMYAKTSPFSTFTNLAMARIQTAPDAGTSEASFMNCAGGATVPAVTSHIRLNNLLFQYLRDLLTRYAPTYRLLHLRPNPTIQRRGDHYHFLTNSHNVEAFQQLPASPVIEVFHELTKSRMEGILYANLVQTVIGEGYIDASADEIEAYLNRLIEFGFLEFNIGISGIDADWDLKLESKIVAMGQPLPILSDLVEMLHRVRELAEKYGKGDVEERKRMLGGAFDDFRAFCMKLHEAAGLPAEERLPREEYAEFMKRKREEKDREKDQEKKEHEDQDEQETKDEVFRHQTSTFFRFTPEQMFYEDTTLEIAPLIDQIQIDKLTSSLHDLLQCLRLFGGRDEERGRMRFYFDRKYGEAKRVDLLTFYEDYYREYKRPEAERIEKERKERLAKQTDGQRPADKDQMNSPRVDEKEAVQETPEAPKAHIEDSAKAKERMNRRTTWSEQFASKMKNRVADEKDDIVRIKLEEVREVSELTSATGATHANCSYGAFVQFFVDPSGNGKSILKGVLNGTFPGFGKMMSRFLHTFNDDITRDVRLWNRRLSNSDLLIEDCDASYFNANLHPPLMPFEIWMPNGHNSLTPEYQIPVTGLAVSPNGDDEALELIHGPSGKSAHVFDLGFQGWKGRSELFQLLETFSMAEYLSYQPVTSSINRLLQTDGKVGEQTRESSFSTVVRIEPRIVVEERLIIQRRAWYIPKELLPLAEPKKSEWKYYCRVNEWRESLHIPDEVFVFLVPRRTDGDIKPEEAKKLGRDDYKPQYISFRNPFLTNLFRKLVAKAPRTLRIEEMLPNSDQLITIAGKKYVTEFLVQWYVTGEDK